MDDAEFERQKDRVAALIEKWVKPLGLGWWDVIFAYERESFEVDGKPAPDAVGRCSANWRYGHAYIEFNVPQVQRQSDAELERAFVHELMHIFLNETRQADEDDWLDHEERVASTLAKAFLWLRDSLIAHPEQSAISSEVATC